MKIQFVLGFAFSLDYKQVALIKKRRPVWQSGRKNGVGGHREPVETMGAAMVREFLEETGKETKAEDWKNFAVMDGADFEAQYYTAALDLSELRTVTDEEIVIEKTADINPWRSDCIENLCWLIPLAMDALHDGRPSFVTVKYF